MLEPTKPFDWVGERLQVMNNHRFTTSSMLNLEWIWEQRHRTAVLLISGGIVLAIAALDWWTKPYISLGFFYLFPMMLAAGFLPRWAIALMGIACALLSERFSNLAPADAPSVPVSKRWHLSAPDCSFLKSCATAD